MLTMLVRGTKSNMRIRAWIITAPLLAFAALLLLSPLARPQGPTATASSAGDTSLAPPHTPDSPNLLRETQLTVTENGHTGLVWWIPFEFWLNSAQERGSPRTKPLRHLGP